jgi:phosphatidylethanolamine-binding protein (PEBP) family uncharacterized protein
VKHNLIIGFVIVACCIVTLIPAILIACSPGSTSPAPELQDDSSRLPPNEEVASCNGRSAGDACQFMDRDGLMMGVCDDRPGILACAPGRNQDIGENAREQTGPLVSNTPPAPVPPTTEEPGQVTAATGRRTFLLTSAVAPAGGMLPAEYTCDGSGSTPELSWSGAPADTKEYALMMTTQPGDGTTKWNWVLYGIPGNTTHLDRNSAGIGITGSGSHGTTIAYDPPCSQGPGPKIYTFTLYALSGSPVLPDRADMVDGPVLTNALTSLTIGRASFNLSYARPG